MKLNKLTIPLGFILEVSLFVTSGYLLRAGYYIRSSLVFLFGFAVALFVGELINRKI